MSPIALDTGSPADPVQSLKTRAKTVDPAIFPDGLKTSGIAANRYTLKLASVDE
jgi:hypothetical protein